MYPLKSFYLTPLLLLAILLSNCATQSFTINQGKAENEPRLEKMQSFFIVGIGQEQNIKPAEVCGGINKVAKVERQYTFLNWFLAVMTFYIYTPYDARVYCLQN